MRAVERPQAEVNDAHRRGAVGASARGEGGARERHCRHTWHPTGRGRRPVRVPRTPRRVAALERRDRLTTKRTSPVAWGPGGRRGGHRPRRAGPEERREGKARETGRTRAAQT